MISYLLNLNLTVSTFRNLSFYYCYSHQFPMPTSIYAGGANGSWVTSVSFSKDGREIATVCEDNRYGNYCVAVTLVRGCCVSGMCYYWRLNCFQPDSMKSFHYDMIVHF